jgi:aminoglycoside 2''-phosphotransferase
MMPAMEYGMQKLSEPYLEAIQRAYPELVVTSAAQIDHGQYNLVLQVNDALIFRFPKYPDGIQILARETALLNHIQGFTSLAIPNPTFVNLANQAVGMAFVGYPLIPGEPLWRETFASLHDPRIHDTLAQQLGGFLTELHRIPLTSELYALAPRSDTAAEWADIFERILRQLSPHMSPEARTRVAQQFEAYLGEPSHFSYTPVLKHGDFGTGNILFDASKRAICGVIDFSGASVGDPAYDLAGLVSSYGQAFVRRLGYDQIDALWERMMFYHSTFALLEALFGIEQGDNEAFESGMAQYR